MPKSKTSSSSIASDRQTRRYRILEGVLGYVSISFLLLLFILGLIAPAALAIFLISYSFLLVLKTSLHGVYTIYTYKNLRRWEAINWPEFTQTLSTDYQKGKQELLDLQDKYSDKLDWSHRVNEDIAAYEEIQGTKYQDLLSIKHMPIFAVYNEPAEVIIRSLQSISEAKYPLENMIVFVSQEGRVGDKDNRAVREAIADLSWTNVYNISETDLDIVYNSDHENLDYKNPEFKKVNYKKGKLTIIFTQHPDGLVGEIKGKASNEDWGGRQVSLFLKATGIDSEKVLITSLDADSRVGENFFHMLSYKFCVSPDRLHSGFQPLPIYSNNFFEAQAFPRLVAVNTTVWYMILTSIREELGFFANYSVPISVLRKIDFWNREVIAEDSLLYSKCLVKYDGNFKVHPFYGTFEGDTVVGEDLVETVQNQYLQLQRWAWGGIEGFPYKFKNFFFEKAGRKVDLRERIRHIRIEILNHFFWATSPIVFSVGVFLPFLFASQDFKESTVQVSLWIFTQYFAWMSFIFLGIATYITFRYIAARALKYTNSKWYHGPLILFQFMISPFIFILWGPPAIDVQIRGILGKYLGYWVTPKK
jgi:cellulose synthase/poly-beta-1,6-N-acetylglucosamine synthase-like glycosyltransferase